MTDRVNMRMAGVPESSFDHWASQFIAKGYKVAKVEQLENMVGKAMRERGSVSRNDEKVIRRELTSVLTAGTLVDAGLLTKDMSTYCMSIKEDVRADHLPPSFGICFVDTATAEFSLCAFADDGDRTKFETLLMQIKPKELVLEKGMLSKSTMRLIKNSLESPQINFLVRDKEFWDEEMTKDELKRGGYFGSDDTSIESWPAALKDAANEPLAMSAVGGLLSYLRTLKLDTDLVSARNFRAYDPVRFSDSLVLDGQTLHNLEIFENSTDGSDRGTLFKLLNHCDTPFGKRLFKQWLCHPLRSIPAINARLDAVDDLVRISGVLDSVRACLRKLPDLERTVARIHTGNCRVKDFVAALAAFKDIYTLVDEMEPYVREMTSSLLVGIFRNGFAHELIESLKYFDDAFDHELASDAGKISLHDGYDEAFDKAKGVIGDIETQFEKYRLDCVRRLGCKSIVYKDIGKEIYQLEVPSSIKAPREWTVMSKTQKVNRYYNDSIRSMVTQMLEAREVLDAAMRSIRSRLYAKFDEQYTMWMNVIRAVAQLDCMCSLAIFRQTLPEPACRPEFVDVDSAGANVSSVFEVDELRHPCVVNTMAGAFIPNDTKLGGSLAEGPRMILLTGPNMGGKSTLLRQTCIAAIMAQIGCYVPAQRCRLSPLDRIFTRIGANDNIMAGQSTFMVELSETSKILREATPRSLVILDELGRGTSTYDGYAIAHAVLHHLLTHVGCLGLFSTHYGTLTEEFEGNPLVANMHMSFFADDENRQVTFLYKLAPGGCPKSYGMNVATMADVPASIVDRADEVASAFERNQKKREATHAVHLPRMAYMASFASLVKAGKGQDLGGSANDTTRILQALCVGANGVNQK